MYVIVRHLCFNEAFVHLFVYDSVITCLESISIKETNESDVCVSVPRLRLMSVSEFRVVTTDELVHSSPSLQWL